MKTTNGKTITIVNKVNGDKIEIINEVINKNGVNYRHYRKTINDEVVMEYTIPISEKRMYRFGVQMLYVEWDNK